MTMWIMFPWAAVRLWNGRWNQMSFGSHPFEASLTTDGLKRRWALLYFAPLGLFVVGIGGGVIAVMSGAGTGVGPNATISGVLIGIFLIVYLAIPLATLHWYAKYYRRAAESLSIAGLAFRFDATTFQWLKLFLGNLALAIVTLGFGLTFWGYRNWAFMVRHLSVHGVIDIDETRQSTTSAPSEAEGFADAFDLGAL